MSNGLSRVSKLLGLGIWVTAMLLGMLFFGGKASAANQVYVDGYGAAPNDSVDDGAAIRKALNVAAGLGPETELIFSAGTYQVSPAPRNWEFDTAGNMEGWSMANQVSGSVSGGGLALTVSGTNPYILSPNDLGLNAGKFKFMKIRMKNDTSSASANLYWITDSDSTYNEAKKQNFTIVANDGQYTEYVVDLRANANWSGLVKQLRVTPEYGASSGTVTVDYVRTSTLPQVAWEFNTDSNMEGWTLANQLTGSASGGSVNASIGGTDPQMLSPDSLNLESGSYSEIRIRMKNNTSATKARLSWTTHSDTVWDANKSATFAINANDADYTEYTLSLGKNTDWLGTIKQLRLYPEQGAASGAVGIDYIRAIPPNPIVGDYHFNKIGLNGLSIKGTNTKIAFTDSFAGGFSFTDSSNVSVQGMTFDYLTPPFVQGQVTAVDSAAGTFDFAPEPGYSLLDDPRLIDVPSKWLTVRDPANPYLMKRTAKDFINVASWEKLNTTTYRLTVPANMKSYIGNADNLNTSDKIVLNQRGTASLLVFTNCAGVSVQDVTVYASPSSSILSQYGTGPVVDGLQVLRSPGSGRWISTNADGVHVQSVTDGPVISNSAFEGILDDAINIYTTPKVLTQVVSDTQIISVAKGGKFPVVGERIQVEDSINGRIRGTANVIAVTPLTGYSATQKVMLTLDAAIPGMVAGKDFGSGDAIYNLSTIGSGFRIRDNAFRESRRFGILLKSANGVVDSNTFTDLGSAAILSENDPNYPEGTMSANIQITNNVIDHVGYLTVYDDPNQGAIKIYSMKLGYKLADERGQRAFVIQNNAINRPPRNGIYVGGAQDVQIIGSNQITASTGDYAPAGTVTGIKAENAANLTVSGLTVNDPRTQLTAGILLGSRTENATASLLNFTLAAGVPNILRLAPDAPEGLTATALNGEQVELDWNEAIGAASYSIYRGDSSGFVPSWNNRIASNVSGSYFIDKGASPLSSFYYKVTTVDGSANESSSSAEARATTTNEPPAPTLAPFVAELYDNDFESRSASGWTTSGGVWSVVEDGTYVYRQGSTSGEYIAYAGDLGWKDYIAEAKIKIAGEGGGSTGTGLAFRYSDNQNYYFLNLKRNTNELRLLKQVGGTWSQIASVPVPQSMNTWYTAKIDVSGTTIKAYLDGTLWITATDGSLKRGAVGFRTYNTSAEFDQVLVNGTKLFGDSFEDGNSQGWTDSGGGNWTVQSDGSYVYDQASLSGDLVSVAGDPTWIDYAVSSKIKMTGEGPDSTGAGLAFRFKDDNNFYYFNLKRNSNELRVMKKVGGTWSVLAVKPYALALNTWYDVKAEVRGSTIVCYVNGVQQFSLTDASLQRGAVGFRAYQTSARMDDVDVLPQ